MLNYFNDAANATKNVTLFVIYKRDKMEQAPLLSGLLRLEQIIGNKKKNIPALIPISRTAWYNGIRAGSFPKPYKITPNCSVWYASEIMPLVTKGN